MSTSLPIRADFREHFYDHAERLQVSQAWVMRRRRVLAAKLAGEPLSRFTPKHLSATTIEFLMQTLAVRPAPMPKSSGILLLVAAAVIPTDDLLRGRRVWRQARTFGSRILPVEEALPMRNLPYGYCWGENGAIVPDPVTAPVVRQAFALILRLGAENGRPPWESAAAALNAAGQQTRTGRPWRAGDVRDLTRHPDYAGYDFRPPFGRGDGVHPLSTLSEPLVDLDTFLTAARMRRRKPPTWLVAMAALRPCTDRHSPDS